MVKGKGIGLLADETGAFFQSEVADIVAQNGVHRARSCEEEAGFGNA
jgi:hypothetical protein